MNRLKRQSFYLLALTLVLSCGKKKEEEETKGTIDLKAKSYAAVKDSLGLGSVGTTYDLSSFKMKIKSVDISQDGTTWTNIFKDGAEEFDVVAGSGTLTFNDVEEGTYNFVMVEFSADAAFRRGDCSDDKTLAMTDSETMKVVFTAPTSTQTVGQDFSDAFSAPDAAASELVSGANSSFWLLAKPITVVAEETTTLFLSFSPLQWVTAHSCTQEPPSFQAAMGTEAELTDVLKSLKADAPDYPHLAYALLGEWSSPCSDSMKVKMRIEKKPVLHLDIIDYDDAACTDVQTIKTTSYNIKLGGAFGSEGADEVDMTVAANTITPDAATAAAYNASSQCGITDWAADKATSVAGKTCKVGSSSTTIYPDVGKVHYSILKIAPGVLLLGTNDGGNDGSTAEKRQSKFANIEFTLQ